MTPVLAALLCHHADPTHVKSIKKTPSAAHPPLIPVATRRALHTGKRSGSKSAKPDATAPATTPVLAPGGVRPSQVALGDYEATRHLLGWSERGDGRALSRFLKNHNFRARTSTTPILGPPNLNK